MLASSVLVSFLLSQQPAPTPVDISDWKAHAKALTDGKGHVLVFDSRKPYDHFFYGDLQKQVQVRVIGGGMNGTESWSAHLWDPRIPTVDGVRAEVSMADTGGRYEALCGKKVTTLKALPAEELAKLLSQASFLPPSWDRLPERLLRDDKGQYYLVDRYRTQDRFDRRDFRLFVGPRGKMKQLPLKDVVDDAEGMIFSSKNGALRLVFGARAGEVPTERKDDFKWVEGKTVLHLTDVSLDAITTGRLVYLDLGVYAGQRLGTPCDDMM